MKTLQAEFNELLEIKGIIENKAFQDFIIKPFRDYQAKMKPAYDCKTLQEIATLKGRKQGTDLLFDILKDIESDYQNKRKELESEVSNE